MLDSVIGAQMSLTSFFLCLGTALLLGLATALLYSRMGRHSAALTQTLAVLPAIVTLVIMMVNGNIGAGMAVAGTFALVRFRSAPGTAKEIAGLFFSVALGMACGMGYVAFAGIFFVVMALFMLLLQVMKLGQEGHAHKQLKITIPENLDYEELFDDILERYTRRHELMRVRTTNMGTLYELSYSVELRDVARSKDFIDELRCRNGNLNISLGREAEGEML